MKYPIGFGLLALLLVVPLCQAAPAKKTTLKQFKATSGQIQAKIESVAPQKNLVIAEQGSVPFDFRVTRHTEIMVAGKKAGIQSLSAYKGQSVTVKYRAMRNGDFAREIDVNARG